MGFNIFSNGIKVTMADMLQARENRTILQTKLLRANPQSVLISLTLNIPGPVKNVAILKEVFDVLYNEIIASIDEDQLCSSRFYHRKTGSELFILSFGNPAEIKHEMIKIENTNIFGRLADLDVLYLKNEKFVVTSRKDFNIDPRKCYLCGNDAKVCGRSRKHSFDEIQQAISRIILHAI